MRFYQYHLEGEIKPFQRVVSQNVQVRPGRLEPIPKVKASWAMIRVQMSTPIKDGSMTREDRVGATKG
jgi:hypothetical protein